MNIDNSSFRMDKVWYSSEKRMKSIWKINREDDDGSIIVCKNRIQFFGKRSFLDISHITNVTITKQTPNLSIIIICGIFALANIGYAFLIIMSSILLFMIFFLIILSFILIDFYIIRLEWVEIEYLENGLIWKAFFTDGSLSGWKQLFSDSNILYDNIKFFTKN